MKKISLLLILLVFVMSGCEMNNTNNNNNSNKDLSTEIDSDYAEDSETITDSSDINSDENFEYEDEELSEEYYEPSDDEITEFGIITEIEDSAYPVFNITVEFPERQMQETFYLNIESISMDMEGLYKLQGKFATIYYTIDDEYDLYDVKLDGKSLLGEYAPEEDYSSDKVTGILEGAEKETYSDLPGIISVTDEYGRKYNFEWFVDELMVKANGKKVTAFYSTNSTTKITHLIPAKDDN